MTPASGKINEMPFGSRRLSDKNNKTLHRKKEMLRMLSSMMNLLGKKVSRQECPNERYPSCQ